MLGPHCSYQRATFERHLRDVIDHVALEDNGTWAVMPRASQNSTVLVLARRQRLGIRMIIFSTFVINRRNDGSKVCSVDDDATLCVIQEGRGSRDRSLATAGDRRLIDVDVGLTINEIDSYLGKYRGSLL